MRAGACATATWAKTIEAIVYLQSHTPLHAFLKKLKDYYRYRLPGFAVCRGAGAAAGANTGADATLNRQPWTVNQHAITFNFS